MSRAGRGAVIREEVDGAKCMRWKTVDGWSFMICKYTRDWEKYCTCWYINFFLSLRLPFYCMVNINIVY